MRHSPLIALSAVLALSGCKFFDPPSPEIEVKVVERIVRPPPPSGDLMTPRAAPVHCISSKGDRVKDLEQMYLCVVQDNRELRALVRDFQAWATTVTQG